MKDQLIRLTLTPNEGLLIGSMLDAAMEQVNAASVEERNDPDIMLMYDMAKRIRPFLPSLEEPQP